MKKIMLFLFIIISCLPCYAEKMSIGYGPISPGVLLVLASHTPAIILTDGAVTYPSIAEDFDRYGEYALGTFTSSINQIIYYRYSVQVFNSTELFRASLGCYDSALGDLEYAWFPSSEIAISGGSYMTPPLVFEGTQRIATGQTLSFWAYSNTSGGATTQTIFHNVVIYRMGTY